MMLMMRKELQTYAAMIRRVWCYCSRVKLRDWMGSLMMMMIDEETGREEEEARPLPIELS